MSDDATAGLQQQFDRHSYQAEHTRFSASVVMGTWNQAVGLLVAIVDSSDNAIHEETVINERITKGERIEHFDTVRMRKGKAPLDISLTISPIRDSSGKIVGASKLAHDITQPKRIERALRESEERYRSLTHA